MNSRDLYKKKCGDADQIIFAAIRVHIFCDKRKKGADNYNGKKIKK